jgi:Lon protease-like protein
MSLVLNCSVCQNQLIDPVTLSCGFTACLACLPSEEEFQKSTFVCPVKQCNKETHLFGPNLFLDNCINQIIKLNQPDSKEITESLQCSIGNHLLQHPITSHCGHSFCKLCVLQYKISNDSCKECQKRLPSYQFIQNQPPNFILQEVLYAYKQHQSPHLDTISAANHISNMSISFNPLSSSSVYQNVPIYLTEFPVLPSQKLRIPIYSEHSTLFTNSLLLCKELQSLCFGILSKDKANHKGHFGTMVKINAVKQRSNDLIIDVIGLDRFQITSVLKETDNFILANLTMKFEDVQNLLSISSSHWIDHREEAFEKQSKHHNTSLPPSPDSPMEDILSTTVAPPTPPPAEPFIYTPEMKLSKRIHDFVSDLAHSTPSTAFCSAVEGLLGPVWLESVQGLHGSLPAADNAVAMCWWAAVVLPVSNADRCNLLKTDTLNDRLDIILSWINDLKSQWGNCRRTAINSAAKVGQ